MQYLYSEKAGEPQLELSGDSHRYLFKVRRHRAGELIYLRNLKDQVLYHYRIEAIDRKRALLLLEEPRVYRLEAEKYLHLGWCLVDPKSIEKVLPSLNEMGVGKITFICCERSQKSFRPDFKRMEKILLNSSQQCGRSVMMELEEIESLELFLERYPEAWMLNFSDKHIGSHKEEIKTALIGPEGGFSEHERTLVVPERVAGLNTHLILRSESAACALAGKILL